VGRFSGLRSVKGVVQGKTVKLCGLSARPVEQSQKFKNTGLKILLEQGYYDRATRWSEDRGPSGRPGRWWNQSSGKGTRGATKENTLGRGKERGSGKQVTAKKTRSEGGGEGKKSARLKRAVVGKRVNGSGSKYQCYLVMKEPAKRKRSSSGGGCRG